MTTYIIYRLKNRVSSARSLMRINVKSCDIKLEKEKRDAGYIVVTVFLDLKCAFETIDRMSLLMKLNKYGIRGKELRWFESYIKQRT